MSGSDRPDDYDSPPGSEVDPEREPRDESDRIVTEERRRDTAVVSGLVAVLGLWVALSVFVYDVAATTFWNNLLVGAVVLVAAGYNYYRQYNDVPTSMGVAALVTVLGIWLVVAAGLGMSAGAFWSTLVTGLLIVGLAGYTTYEAREARAVTTDELGTS